MSNMGYSAWRQAREAADGPDDWVAPGGPDAGEQQGEGPMWDRLVWCITVHLSNRSS